MQKLTPTVRVPHVQRKDELAHHQVGGTNAYRAESCGTVKFDSLTGISEILMQVPTTQEAQKTVEAH